MAAQHILFFCIFLLATLDASGRRERPRLSIITEISHESDEKADFYSDDEKEDAPLIQQHPPPRPFHMLTTSMTMNMKLMRTIPAHNKIVATAFLLPCAA